MSAIRYTFNYYRRGGTVPAMRALEQAREAKVARWQTSPWVKPTPPVTHQSNSTLGSKIYFIESPEAVGMRVVGRVQAEPSRYRDTVWERGNEKGGWYTDPYDISYKDGTGLCWGVVLQLPTRKGTMRFIPGWQLGGDDGDGVTIDLGHIYEETASSNNPVEVTDLDAAYSAAATADGHAKAAAEMEREYQCAWQAGREYSELGEEIQSLKKDLAGIFSERRRVKDLSGEYPAICESLKKHVSALIREIQEKRERRATLKNGDDDRLSFWPGNPDNMAAFNEAVF